MMNLSKSGCACGGAAERYEELAAILARYQEVPGALIPVLQQAQDAYGYLSREVLERIAEGLKLPISQVYGVVTFYSQFHLNPRGKHIVRVCQGTACHVRGAKAILEAMEKELGVKPGETTADLNFTLETVACIGACGLAPVMMIDDDTYGRLTPEGIGGILQPYRGQS